LRAALPYATGYKNEIQQQISQQIGLPVEIDSIDAAINWFSPRLKLIDVSVFDEKNKVPLFNFHEAFVELDIVASILRGELIMGDVGLIGADISIEKLSEKEWLIQGVKVTSEGSSELPDRFLYMLQNADYLLHDSNIYYQDHTGEKLSLELSNINIDVNNNYNNHDIKFSMNLPEEYGDNLAVVANLTGNLDSLAGDIYVEVNQLKVNQWNNKFKILKSHAVDAVLDISLWGTLQDNKIKTLFTQLTSKNVSIKNNGTGKTWGTDFLSTNIRYATDEAGRNITVSDFQFGEKSHAVWQKPVNLIISDDDEDYYISSDFLRISDLQKMAEAVLSEEALAKLDKITAYQVSADIYNLNVKIQKDVSTEELLEKIYLDASIYDFSMYVPEKEINLSGIDAAINFENGSATIDVFTQDAEVVMPKVFREPLSADTLQGKVVLTHDKDMWQINSDHLQVKNSHINTFSRFDVQFSSAKDIFIDAETAFYNAQGKNAKHYLPVGIMKPKLIDWLDKSIIDGDVPDGKFILHGNLHDFPYKEHNGVFQVLFSAKNVDLQFLEQWPSLTDASASIKFNNLSLVVENARAKTGNASLYNGYAEINDLMHPYLAVSTDAHGKNEDLQQYVWNSPLDKAIGNSLRLFQFRGESDLNLKIDVPLDVKGGEVVIDGHLNFIDSEIYYPALGYGINSINGVVDFTRDSIFAESVKAKVQKNPVTLNAFTRNGASGKEKVFRLDGVLDADYLLQHFEWIPKDWVSGQSKWSIDVAVPASPKDYLVHIKAKSQLENVVLQVSDKVKKPAGKKIDLSTEIDVLSRNGLHVDASAGTANTADILDLYAVRDDKSLWSFDVKSDYITGKGEFTEGLGKTTRIKLDLENADVYKLFVSENKKQSKPLKPADFPAMSWKSKKVLWDDWVFTDVNLETSWHEHGMLINTLSLKGPAMTFDAKGSWLTSWRDSHETVLQGNIKSSNLGDTLTGLGFQRSIDRCEYNATFESSWAAEPYSFSWGKIKGKTSFEMEDGEILEVDPGAGGRLLGLLNIFKLTNRLAFDFDDVYRKGFSFDYINGDFEFLNGNGSLKNFDVIAPAADINMFGRVGIVDHDYGLLMRVKPHTGTLTFAGGAMLGGVVVGAGLALIEKVFDLDVIGQNVYSITGSWDDPHVEKIIERSMDTSDEEGF
jgi:uncharacterized protein YhdP